MLDALKFAFEILIVGALALPWLAILIRIAASGSASNLPSYLSVVPRPARSTVAVAVVIAFGYVAGSAISRASRDLFNDELLRPIPTENRIRDAVYQDQYCAQELIYMDENLPLFDGFPSANEVPVSRGSSLAKKRKLMIHQNYKQAFCPGKQTPEILDARIQEMFGLQEGELLLQGQDKVDRLKQYYDQITVLRGAALNAFILCVVCAFGYFGNLRARYSKNGVVSLLAYMPAGALLLWGASSLSGHFQGMSAHATVLFAPAVPTSSQVLQISYSDPPFAELVIMILGLLGLFVTSKAKNMASYFRTSVVAAAITLVCFGGWWWTEVMYDLAVVHSQIELHPAASTVPTAATAIETASQNGPGKPLKSNPVVVNPVTGSNPQPGDSITEGAN